MTGAEQRERVLGDVATKLLFENERVRIWEMELAPGEASAVHRHDHDYILVLLEGDRIRAIAEPDSQGPYPGVFDADVTPGQAIYVERGGIETAVNCGEKPYREILIELLETGR